MRFGLSEEQINEISGVLAKFPEISEALIFGSRAGDNFKEASDVDIAIKGDYSGALAGEVKYALEEDTYLPFFFDVVDYSRINAPELKNQIDKYGVSFYKTGWKECKLGEICEITSSKRIFYSEYVEDGVPFFRSKEIIDLFNRREIQTELYITEQRFNDIKEKFGVPLADDILLTSVGSLGIPYKVKHNDKFYFKDGNLTWFRNLNKRIILPDFLFIWLSSNVGKQKLDEVSIGSSQAALTISGLKTIEIQLPDLKTQTAIAYVLSSLDDKIDLLHRQNKTLEAMAETLFRQWFVEEAKEEWEEGKLGDLVIVKYGKDHKKLQDGKIPVFGSGGIMRFGDASLYENESVLIPRKGSLNNVIYINEPFWTVDTMFYTVMKKKNIAKFIYHFVKELDLASMNVGSAVPSMTTEMLNNIPISIPPDAYFEQFENIIKPLFQKSNQNKTQINILTSMRETLLPKLMSGEVRVGAGTGF